MNFDCRNYCGKENIKILILRGYDILWFLVSNYS
jgi:hypothetical protein